MIRHDPKDIEESAKELLRKSLPIRIDLFDVGTAATLIRLNSFASSIRNNALDAVLTTILPGGVVTGSTAEVVGRISDALIKDRDGREYDVLRKSLQETLYIVSDLDFENSFRTKFHAFVYEAGGRGLIRLFLGLHLSNVVWKQLHDSFQVTLDVEVLEKLADSIQEVCLHAVTAATSAWNKWPEIGERSASRLLLSLRAQLVDLLADATTIRARAV